MTVSPFGATQLCHGPGKEHLYEHGTKWAGGMESLSLCLLFKAEHTLLLPGRRSEASVYTPLPGLILLAAKLQASCAGLAILTSKTSLSSNFYTASS